MDDRKLGYIILALLLVSSTATVIYLAPSWAPAAHTRNIVFGNVRGQSFLSPQDPVRVYGVEVGKVADIFVRGSDAHVAIETRQPLKIYEGYAIKVSLRGIMGETFLAVVPGDSSAAVVPESQLLQGTVEMSPPDALAYVDTLRTVVRKLTKLTADLKDGTADSRSLIVLFNDVVSYVDSMTVSLLETSKIMDVKVANSIDTLADLLGKTARMSTSIGDDVPGMVVSLQSLVTKTERLIEQVSMLIEKSEQLVTRFNDPQSPLRGGQLRQLHDQLRTLREVISDIQHDGLKLPVRPSTSQ